MDNHPQDNLLFSTPELICILQTAQVTHLANFFKEILSNDLTDVTMEKVRNDLTQRNILTKTGKINSQYIETLSPLLHPDKMLVSVRIRSSKGQESITYLRKDDSVMLYYFIPAQDMHCFENIEITDQIPTLLAEWYGLEKFIPLEVQCSLAEAVFEQVRSRVQEGKASTALDLLKNANCPATMSEQLILALRKPALSGSVAVLELDGDTAVDGYSLALMAYQEALWHMYQPDTSNGLLVIDGNVNSLRLLLDRITQRFLGDDMLDEPLDKKNVATFTLGTDELAYCLRAINAPAMAAGLLSQAYPEVPEQELRSRLQDAGNRLLARGWCKPAESGLPVPVARLEEAVFPLARFDYTVQAEITRTNLHSLATINVLKKRSFTSVLQPKKDVYVLEHGHESALTAYLSKLFLDFGEGTNLKTSGSHAIDYKLVSKAMESEPADQVDLLINAGFSKHEAESLAIDLANTQYRGSIIRVNAGSQENPEVAQQSLRPVLLLLRGVERSWLFEFSSADEDTGQAAAVDKTAFTRVLSTFLN